MSHLDNLKEAAREQIAHLLPSNIFDEFDQLNSRMLIAVTCLQRGLRDLRISVVRIHRRAWSQ